MKKLLLSLILISSTIPTFSQTLRARVARQANEIEQQVISWRRDFHEHPELGNHEVRTAGIIAAYLKSLGIEVKTGVAKTGVVGVLKGGKPGPVVALRADMDGLPVVERTNVPFASKVKTTFNNQEVGAMHACGHDSHMAILMGTAKILESMKSELAGTVKFIFQPAEEGPPFGEEGGAALMVKEGVLENPKVDAIFGLHIQAETETGKITYRPGGTMAAVNDMQIIVKGKSSHGAYPWSSIDPVVVAAQIINNLQPIISRNLNVTENPGIVTIGSIHGGNRSNIIPERVEMMGTLRAMTAEDMRMIVARVQQVVIKTAESAGATADVKIPYSASYPVTFNDVALTEKMLPSLQASAGATNLLLKPPVTGAEDFSFFQEKVPGVFIFLGAMPKGTAPGKAAPHHTPDFYLDESSFKLGVNTMCNLVIDYLALSRK